MGNTESNSSSPAGVSRPQSCTPSPCRTRRAVSFAASSPQHRAARDTIVRRKSGNDGDVDRQKMRHDEANKCRPSHAPPFRSHSEQRSLQSSGMEKERTLSNDLSGASLSGLSLRQCTGPQFQICGDLDPHQINVVRRTWKQQLHRNNDNEFEMAIRLLLRIFRIEPRLQSLFNLGDIPYAELRNNAYFNEHVKVVEPILSFVLSHLHDATAMSKHLQLLGGRHVRYTKVTYKSVYWKIVIQAMTEFVGADRALSNVYDAWIILGGFCVEQMRIGYKIQYKLQRVAARLDEKYRKSNDSGIRKQSSCGRQSIC
uniref:GLOBIN domain-containing protein n=1 Tax=Ascaris lumbricoides TaxID=6252 RepID=A0A0M3I0H2_ASCLU